MLKQLWMDEAGFVVSAELAIVLTLGVLAMVIGIHSVAKAVTAELGDFANAIGVLDQTYSVGGLAKGSHGSVNGAAFADRQDLCDCSVVTEPDPTPKIDASSGTVESG